MSNLHPYLPLILKAPFTSLACIRLFAPTPQLWLQSAYSDKTAPPIPSLSNSAPYNILKTVFLASSATPSAARSYPRTLSVTLCIACNTHSPTSQRFSETAIDVTLVHYPYLHSSCSVLSRIPSNVLFSIWLQTPLSQMVGDPLSSLLFSFPPHVPPFFNLTL